MTFEDFVIVPKLTCDRIGHVTSKYAYSIRTYDIDLSCGLTSLSIQLYYDLVIQ